MPSTTPLFQVKGPIPVADKVIGELIQIKVSFPAFATVDPMTIAVV